VERFKLERISSEESIRKLISVEERTRTSQNLGIQESLKTIRHDLASDIRADLIDWKQLYHGLKKNVKDLMQEGLQVIVSKLSDQMEQNLVLLQKEISECKRKSDVLDQRITSRVQLGEESGENNRICRKLEEEFETSLKNARPAVSVSAHHEVPEEVSSQQPIPLLRTLASPHFVFTSAAVGLPQEQCGVQPKFDLVEEVGVLTQKFLGKHQDLGWMNHSQKDAAH